MQANYTTASILLLTSVLAAPNTALVERDVGRDIESALSTGINIVTSDFGVASLFRRYQRTTFLRAVSF
jgi:hypothetical protein